MSARAERAGAAAGHDTAGRPTRAFVLHPDIPSRGQDETRRRRDPARALEEAVALAAALPDLEVVGAEVVRLARPHPGTLFGAGKLEELGRRFKEEGVDLVLVDGP
ncbi:MAG: hypothetical protein D6811_04230, partial [Alphaproteobacteria bacterium]